MKLKSLFYLNVHTNALCVGSISTTLYVYKYAIPIPFHIILFSPTTHCYSENITSSNSSKLIK